MAELEVTIIGDYIDVGCSVCEVGIKPDFDYLSTDFIINQSERMFGPEGIKLNSNAKIIFNYQNDKKISFKINKNVIKKEIDFYDDHFEIGNHLLTKRLGEGSISTKVNIEKIPFVAKGLSSLIRSRYSFKKYLIKNFIVTGECYCDEDVITGIKYENNAIENIEIINKIRILYAEYFRFNRPFIFNPPEEITSFSERIILNSKENMLT